MSLSVLVVEDELAVREALRFHLEQAGYTVWACATAREAWDQLVHVNAVVLDWMLPDESGISWLSRLRANTSFSSLPVLMLTARAGERDRVEGLDAGADDYLTKPFSAAELAARVRALLRRVGIDGRKSVIRLGSLEIDQTASEARLAGRVLNLTRREFDLLAFMGAHAGRVYSRQELLDRVWGLEFVGGERTVDQHITQLRAILDENLTAPRFLETVRGKGYRMREVIDFKPV
jgi:two-component system, OmpR family, response regulator RegX3